jgi:hypothetical protein
MLTLYGPSRNFFLLECTDILYFNSPAERYARSKNKKSDCAGSKIKIRNIAQITSMSYSRNAIKFQRCGTAFASKK